MASIDLNYVPALTFQWISNEDWLLVKSSDLCLHITVFFTKISVFLCTVNSVYTGKGKIKYLSNVLFNTTDLRPQLWYFKDILELFNYLEFEDMRRHDSCQGSDSTRCEIYSQSVGVVTRTAFSPSVLNIRLKGLVAEVL